MSSNGKAIVGGYVRKISLTVAYQEWEIVPTKKANEWDAIVVRYPYPKAGHPRLGRFVVATGNWSNAQGHEVNVQGWDEYASLRMAQNWGFTFDSTHEV